MEHQDVPEKLDEAIASAMELQAIELQLVQRLWVLQQLQLEFEHIKVGLRQFEAEPLLFMVKQWLAKSRFMAKLLQFKSSQVIEQLVMLALQQFTMLSQATIELKQFSIIEAAATEQLQFRATVQYIDIRFIERQSMAKQLVVVDDTVQETLMIIKQLHIHNHDLK